MTDSDDTRTIGELVAMPGSETCDRKPVDWEAATEAYIAQAKRETAIARYAAFAENHPIIVETDWERPQYQQNRHVIDRVIGWSYCAKGMLLTGESGRGKTRSLAALFRRLACEDGRDVIYVFAGDWFAGLQAQVNYGRDDARGWVEAWARRPIVMIDDLGKEAIQTSRERWAESWFFRFLDIRINAGLPLIIATNQSAGAIAGGAATGREMRADPMLRRILQLCQVVRFA